VPRVRSAASGAGVDSRDRPAPRHAGELPGAHLHRLRERPHHPHRPGRRTGVLLSRRVRSAPSDCRPASLAVKARGPAPAARGVRTEQGTLETVAPRLPGRFGAVVFQHSLEHVVEPADDLLLARALLADGGLLLISVPNFASWESRRFGTNWFHLDLPRHRSHFTPDGLEALLRRTGFVTLSLDTSTSADGLPMSLQYRLLGRRRLVRGPALYLAAATAVLLVPLVVAVDRLEQGGDVLHAAGQKPR
jgi:Methyltransferase domain